MISKSEVINLWTSKPANMDLIIEREDEDYDEDTDETTITRCLRKVTSIEGDVIRIKSPTGRLINSGFCYSWKRAFYLKKGHFAKFEKIGKDKKPTTATKHIGVEIEFISQLSADEIKKELADSDLEDYVNLKGDASIDNDDSHPFTHELCILATEGKIAAIVTEVCRLLKGNSKVNSSCGLHVHLDMRHRDKTESYKRLYVAQPMLYAMCPPSRVSSTYCEMQFGYDEFKSDAVSDTRYCGINTQAYFKYKTIEVRIHSGSLEASKINNWIKLLTKIVDSGRAVSPNVEYDYASLKRLFNIDEELDTYIKQRIRKFASKHDMPELEAIKEGV